MSSYPPLRVPLQAPPIDPGYSFSSSLGGRLVSPHDTKSLLDHRLGAAFSTQSKLQAPDVPINNYRQGFGVPTRTGAELANQNPLLVGPETASSNSPQDFLMKDVEGNNASGRPLGRKGGRRESASGEGNERPPPWSELKTKAGKERKRLPLACIACRRKKIRCSGEKPACKHCLRSRIPCVYKVTTRKAAPRTDYMAMLDKRLKRMEERVIKTIPEEDTGNIAAIGRANVRPVASGHGSKAHSGKKRAAEEAFGPHIEEWATPRTNKPAVRVSEKDNRRTLAEGEGANKLPSKELQEHLVEVFFDCLYGQSYLLLHKPSFMRRLRAGSAAPVLVLAVCAIAARFSTHPQVRSEPAFLRGEEWAAPARDIALRRYDQPSITILTVLLILGLHEFGTCQGGRSWMFGGMAMRMAYALQLHRESDHDPLSRNNGSDPKLSATDQEIRRRTMWACFLMDRFNSSGTERPTCGTEEHIKVQLPIKEFNFLNEIPGPTENLDGDVPCSVTPDAGQDAKMKENMGVASYMIRIIALWGRVIRYLNLGGKERDPYPLWHSSSQYRGLKKQADDFKNSLPPTIRNSPDNLANHAAEKLANQFLFMHISYHQVVLFLHRYAIPTTPGTRIFKDVPKEFLSDAVQVALEAADQISVLIGEAREHNLIAPFAGYCAFTSSTVHIWGMFSKNSGREESSKQKLQLNLEYIRKMKKYWGMFHFMADNLEDIYKRYADASQKGTNTKESSGSESNLFQYGDWFKKYPNGVSESDYEDPAAKVKEERIDEAAVSHKSDLQSVDEFINKLSPPVRTVPPPPKPRRKASKPTNSTAQPHPPQVLPPDQPQESTVQRMLPMTPQTPVAPSPFSPHQSQPLYASFPPQPYDLLAQHPNTALLPQLDRNLVYDAYAGTSGPPLSSSDPAFNSLTVGNPTGSVWDNPLGYGNQSQALGDAVGYASEMQSSAWFMPFNMPPPSFPGDGGGGYGGFGVDARNADGMGGGGDVNAQGGRSQ